MFFYDFIDCYRLVFLVKKITVGSICSGIEAASVAFDELSYEMAWFSEIADFPSRLLKEKYPNIHNYGDMCNLSDLITSKNIDAPDLICGGTPCQAFSLAGWKKGLEDDRGNLTLKLVDIIEKNDNVRSINGKQKTIMLWENVEGVLNDKTNAFGCFLSLLLGLNTEIKINKWPSAGIIHGVKRNVAWRVLDAKYFGLPHQRKRLYVVAGGKDFYPENVIFDGFPKSVKDYKKDNLIFNKNGYEIEVFRSYTDCLYSAYGTKWNGNAAAYNGSLFIVQDKKIRRLTPLECERLMGFPDGYTNIEDSKRTNRYQAVGNSWAVPVIKWIGKRIEEEVFNPKESIVKINNLSNYALDGLDYTSNFFEVLINKNNNQNSLFGNVNINGTVIPEFPVIGNIENIIDTNPDDRLFISPVGCKGILRRKEERGIKINERLEYFLSKISSAMSDDDIEALSRVQTRGRYSR